MQLGLVTAILPELSLEEVLRFARDTGFACVEVMCWPAGKAERKFAGVTHLDVTHFTEARAEDTRALVNGHGVALSALGYYPNPLDPDPERARRIAAHLRQVILAAERLGLKNVNTFVGRDWTKSVDANWPRFLKTWRPLIAFAEDHGVKIGIENCPMFFTGDEWPGGKNLATTPVIWRRMFADIPSDHFGLNYDPSHFILQQMDPVSPLWEFRDKLFHLHAKDVRIQRDRLNETGIFAHPAEWHQQRIPGFGDIDWPRFLAAVRATGYRGPVCIEVEDDTFGQDLAGRKQAVRVARNVLTPFFHPERPMKYSYEALAGLIDHALLHPTITDAEMRAGCELARRYAVASVCIKPFAVDLAAALLRDSGVAVGTVIGFPHGGSATEIKRAETALACRDGAVEIDMVVNIGKVLSGDWDYVEEEVCVITDEARRHGALLKVIFETGFLTDDVLKIRLCEICDRGGVDFVKTSTGFGFVRQPEGGFAPTGATGHDLALLRAHTSKRVGVKASGGVRDLDGLIAVRELGATRCGTSATAQILDEYQRRAATETTATSTTSTTCTTHCRGEY